MKKIAAREWVYEWPTPQEAAEFEDLLEINQILTLAFQNLAARSKDPLAKKKLPR